MKRIAVVVASVLVIACSSAKKPETSQMSEAGETKTNVPQTPISTAAADLSALEAEMRSLKGESEYFDFDKSVIKPEYVAMIRKQAEFIKGHKNDVVTLEGNADERGSEKYNLGLGNRRAGAVFEALVNMGVPAAQLKTVSFGKDKPRLSCHKEKCWKENRRVDFDHNLV